MRESLPERISPIAPYLATLVGLYWAHSAWLAIGLYHLIMGAVLLARRPESRLRQLAQGWNWRAGLPHMLLGLAAGPTILVLWPTIAREPEHLNATLADLGLQGQAFWIFAVYFVLVNPVLEEVFWRSAPRVRRGRPALSDFAFAGYHALVLNLFLDAIWTLVATVLLVLVAWSWRRTIPRGPGLAIPLLAHALAGLSIITAVAYLMRS